MAFKIGDRVVTTSGEFGIGEIVRIDVMDANYVPTCQLYLVAYGKTGIHMEAHELRLVENGEAFQYGDQVQVKKWPVRGKKLQSQEVGTVHSSREVELADGSKARVYTVWIADSWVHVGANQLRVRDYRGVD